ncbi:MAG: tRNA (adenosine(37)-N6)-dimethylallyltransferase MiaA [Phycisphaerae bacterium]|nr:tRNA (adenosine(37)-N6)-dimethylallyltransferase MiaA [Phycisphaerae bacterium]
MTAAAPEFLVVLGQTASGKERVALALARQLDGEIVSCDSMKVYRGMDIGTAKAAEADRRSVPHHLLNVVDPWERFSAARWAQAAEAAVADIVSRGRLPIVSGGTVLYLKALVFGLFEGPGADAAIRARLADEADRHGTVALHARLADVDPQAARRIHPNDLRRIVRALEVHELTGQPISTQQRQFDAPRPDLRPWVAALRRTRDDLHRRIDDRVDRMIAHGLADEVRRLTVDPRGMSSEAAAAVGYREMIDCLQGRLPDGRVADEIKKNTRLFARRQMTHLRSLALVRWIDVPPNESPDRTAQRIADLWRARAAEPEAPASG